MSYEGHTRTLAPLTLAALPNDALYIFRISEEEERDRAGLWGKIFADQSRACTRIIREGVNGFSVLKNGCELEISYTDQNTIRETFAWSSIYIDITGLTHNTWSSLVRALRAGNSSLFAIFTEPDSYSAHKSPSSSNFFDLTVSFAGIAPLPGMANLSGPENETQTIFVSFLGFETARAEHVAASVDPLPSVFPIVGLPGYRFDYPQITIASNERFIHDSQSAHKIRYAKGSCPFEAYDILAEIERDNPDYYIYISLTGTKPHSLGAVLYSLDNSKSTEIIYDHPTRKSGRTSGVGVSHIYRLSDVDVRY